MRWDFAEAGRVEEWPARLGYHRASVNTYHVIRLAGQLPASNDRLRLQVDAGSQRAPWVLDDLADMCVALRGFAHKEALAEEIGTDRWDAPSAWVAYSNSADKESKPLGAAVVRRRAQFADSKHDTEDLQVDIMLHPSLIRRRALGVVHQLLRAAQPVHGAPVTLTADERVALTLNESARRIVPLSTAVCLTVTRDAYHEAKRLMRRAERNVVTPAEPSRRVA
jgi:hypothetical protein